MDPQHDNYVSPGDANPVSDRDDIVLRLFKTVQELAACSVILSLYAGNSTPTDDGSTSNGCLYLSYSIANISLRNIQFKFG